MAGRSFQHYRLARAYTSAGRDQDADREFSLYTQFRDAHKNTEKDARDCTAALQTGPPATAREVCHRVFGPNDPEKLTLLGQLFGDAGAFEEALDPLKRAVQLDSKSFEAWHNLGLTYFRLQRYAEARAAGDGGGFASRILRFGGAAGRDPLYVG
ncbi:MAG: tetratricopeptide repeat protein [Acidobacteriia bacterium]|nr:tetratricopeptide repeat protein [Terriglobia bacterium]